MRGQYPRRQYDHPFKGEHKNRQHARSVTAYILCSILDRAAKAAGKDNLIDPPPPKKMIDDSKGSEWGQS